MTHIEHCERAIHVPNRYSQTNEQMGQERKSINMEKMRRMETWKKCVWMQFIESLHFWDDRFLCTIYHYHETQKAEVHEKVFWCISLIAFDVVSLSSIIRNAMRLRCCCLISRETNKNKKSLPRVNLRTKFQMETKKNFKSRWTE